MTPPDGYQSAMAADHQPAVQDEPSRLATAAGFFREPDTPPAQLSPKRFAEVLGIDLQTLAAQARVHRNTISRAPGSASVQHFLRQVLRVLKAAEDLSSDRDQAVLWYRNEPLAVFDYQTAEQLVASGRAEDVLRYIAALEAGAAG